MNRKLTESILPWYRHRWPWLLMLGPLVVVVAGVITTWLAVRSNDGLVDDDYYKLGLAVNQTTARDHRAGELGLAAEISLDAERKMIRVSLRSSTGANLPSVLRMNIAHPTRNGLDQHLLLQADGPASFVGSYSAPLVGRWRVVLEDDRKEWRLAGDWVVESQALFKLPVVLPRGA
jgi:hypothetical protein